jgi:Domain of unknown function (DUF222)
MADQVPNWVDFSAARPAGQPAIEDVIGAGYTHADEGHFPVAAAGAFEAGGPADLMPPCSVLAELTGQALEAGVDRLTDDELVGVMRAARRLASWQSRVELAAAEELAARRQAEKRDAGPDPAERTSAELAAAMTLTSRSADRLLDLANGVARLEDVAMALERGEIDLAKAAVFVDELSVLPWLSASVIAGRNLLAAPGLTTGQLRSILRRAVLAADPDGGRRRQREARKDTRVEAWAELSGNSALTGRELPAARTLLADRHISALAKALQAAGVAGTLDEVRAEVFLALLTGQSPESLLAAAEASRKTAARPGQSGRSAESGPDRRAIWPDGPMGTVHLTMPLSAWLGFTGAPGDVAGHGPVDTWTARDLAAVMATQSGTSYCLSVTTPQGHPIGHACTTRPPPGPPPLGPAPPGVPEGLAGWLAGLKVEWLERGTCSHSRQTKAYKPGKALDHLIKIRNATCTAPGCRRAAQRCDIDHVVPFHEGGRTCECNCHPLCRRHHRCKGSAGWHVDMPEPGVVTWRLPHGRGYQTSPEAYPV